MKSLSNLTVGEYQALYAIHTSKDEEIDKAVLSVAIVTQKTRWEVEEMPLDEFTLKAREISILFSATVQGKTKNKVKVNGQSYYVCLNPRKLSAGQYIDLQHFLKGNLIENLHKLMACLLIPLKKYWFVKRLGKYDGENHEKISEGIQDLKFVDIHSTCVFFSTLWSSSIKALIPYLTKELKTKSPLINQTDLQTIMDGYIMPPLLRSTKE